MNFISIILQQRIMHVRLPSLNSIYNVCVWNNFLISWQMFCSLWFLGFFLMRQISHLLLFFLLYYCVYSFSAANYFGWHVELNVNFTEKIVQKFTESCYSSNKRATGFFFSPHIRLNWVIIFNLLLIFRRNC